MRGLSAPRVVLLDDSPDEAQGMITALRSRGIAALYVDGKVENIPEKVLAGVRLAVLDLDLSGLYGTAPEHVVSPTVTLLARLISRENGPYLAVAWTSHADLVAALQVGLKAEGIPPVAVVLIDKTEVIKADGTMDIVRIADAIDKATGESHPYQLLVEWEHAAYEAGGATVRTLLGNWAEDGADVVAALASSSRQTTASDGALMHGVGEFMARFHADELESSLTTLATDAALVAKVRASAKAADDAMRGELNRRLLIGGGHLSAVPGNLYVLGDLIGAAGEGLQAAIPTLENVKSDIDSGNVWMSKLDSEEHRISGFALEVTPSCDDLEGRKFAHFVAGLAVSKKALSGKQIASFKGFLRDHSLAVRSLPPICSPWLFGSQPAELIWAARLTFTVPLGLVADVGAKARLRHDALADIQHWLAGYSARPGYLLV